MDWDRLSFRLLSVQALKGTGEAYPGQQLLFSYALAVVTNGSAQFIADHSQYELGAGSALILLPGQTCGTVQPAGGLEMYILYFEVYSHGKLEDTGYLIPVKGMRLYQGDGRLQFHPSREMTAKWNRLCLLSGQADGGIGYRDQLHFQELLYELRTGTLHRTRDTNSALEQAKQYIEAHYTEALTVEQIAQSADFSAKYFVDLYKRKYGKSALEYAAELRLQQAKRLMAESGAKLRDIAHKVGYADEFYFSRKFKKMIGIPPAVYMKSRRRKLAAYTPGLLGQLLPLNITPYAAALHPKWTEYYYRNYRADIPVHISAYRNNQEWLSNIELLKQSGAELILAPPGLADEERAGLERIADVHDLFRESADWRGQLQELARFLGEEWQCGQWLETFDWEVRAAKEHLHEGVSQRSVTVLRMLGSQLFLHCNEGMASLLYGELELRPAYECGEKVYNVPVTPARLAELQPDYLLMLIRQEYATLAEWKKLQNDPHWLRIPAVQHHHVHGLSSDPWREDSAYAQLRKLRQLLQLLPANRP
ncbi:AraC family transcriptional regulator [Paenibacillus sp. PK3_47]|uniref:helix-turn-helix domain-containing protein n=1 Tax=Paenibacillus sp. PK3_47 TaxID=2072642 RepID=UPI00201E2531|nr:AraC family transcriptional regulator [Paenibacillus sp. PK3_47]UQZ35987.1 AraC family transcriptional regulator [Paenibacillus sp. PK3_47]